MAWPVRSAARDGVHDGAATKNWVNRVPSRAMRSKIGVHDGAIAVNARVGERPVVRDGQDDVTGPAWLLGGGAVGPLG